LYIWTVPVVVLYSLFSKIGVKWTLYYEMELIFQYITVFVVSIVSWYFICFVPSSCK